MKKTFITCVGIAGIFILSATFIFFVSIQLASVSSSITKSPVTSSSTDNEIITETFSQSEGDRGKMQNEPLQKNIDDNENTDKAEIRTYETRLFQVDGNGHNERDTEDICHPFPAVLPSAATIWNNHLQDIYESTLNANIGRDDYRSEMVSWIALLLDHLSTLQLMKSVKTIPNNINHLRPIIKILQDQREYYVENNRNGPEPPPLKILVLGGSVTNGVLCRLNPLNKVFSPVRKLCAWTNRLEKMINTLFGYRAVYIFNDSLGGTNSEHATLRFDFDLLPKSLSEPDIVINSYSSNDMHVLSMSNAEAKNKTLMEAVFDMNQSFIRSVETRKKCVNPYDDTHEHRPLLIYLDDYLGNEQHEILETMAFSSTMQLLCNYYGIMCISYADAVRHIVYANTRETWFSSNWYEPNGAFVRQIHPGLGAHISIMWVVAFNLLNVFITFCNEESFHISRNVEHMQVANFIDSDNVDKDHVYAYKGWYQKPDIKLSKTLDSWPSYIPHGVIPELTPDLKLQDISSLWRESSKEYLLGCQSDDTSLKKSCTFSWIGSLNGINSENDLSTKMKQILVENNGWGAVLDNGKLGFVPVNGTIGSNFTMEIKDAKDPIKRINFMTMKSYGERWKDSRILIVVAGKKSSDPTQFNVIEEMEIEGFHASNTSVTYNYKIELKDAEIGDHLQVTVSLIGGATYKISGISFCS